ncbi:MAG: carbonic anhydrase [Nitrospinota bacterium]
MFRIACYYPIQHPTDLFVVQVTGNLIKDSSLVRLEYAVENFGVPLIFVLGHQNCKVIEKTMEKEINSGHFPGFDKRLTPEMESQMQKAVDELCKTHIWLAQEEILRFSEIFRKRVDNGTLQITGGFYNSKTGRVEPLDRAQHKAL